jgi:hypothetical protein
MPTDDVLFDDNRLESSLGEVQRSAAAMNATTDDDSVGLHGSTPYHLWGSGS